jgi:hypothetical protein
MSRTIRTIRTAVAAAAVIALALAACNSFTPEKEKPVEENRYPQNYKKAILDRLAAQLTDPRGIRGAFLAEPVLKPRDTFTGYIA